MSSRLARLALPWLLLLVVALVAAWLRYGLIESSAIGQQCGASNVPAWCDWRQALVLGFLHNAYGMAALVAAALALWRQRLWLAWLAAALGIFALELYCFEAGALALLLGSLRLLRLQARPTPVDEHRHGQQQVHSQP
ncbi:hypothetical protein EAH88_14160 [Rhodanobacter glycinis]|uniref:Uncharacterized protein n=1 Tax=Rhodanobacter glycinis TaxID=582702 RepID=A0A502C3Z1_9GAMM|nr:hypothetical protein [Rhodanobacter glycinis]TPG06466.1 hypothetical protein EAH88_14160 [Rhodanobacter glycinis]